MGTRADFYDADMTWLASIAWDGNPDGLSIDVRRAKSDETFKANLATFLAGRDDVTLPSRGWPWPWETSATTDYAYMIRDGRLHASCFGSPWFPADEPEPEKLEGDAPDFPDMTDRKNVRYDVGSGLLVFGA